MARTVKTNYSQNSIAVGPALKIGLLHLNVEGLSAAKKIIGEIAHHHKADVICLQKTHILDIIAGRYSITGYDLCLPRFCFWHNNVCPVRHSWCVSIIFICLLWRCAYWWIQDCECVQTAQFPLRSKYAYNVRPSCIIRRRLQ